MRSERGGGGRLELTDVVKRFGGVVANSGVSTVVEGGEIRGLIGPNGSGKSTLANLISGIYRPTSGAITLDGHSLVGLRPHQVSRLGLMRTFQIARPFASMTVLDNLLVARQARPGEIRGRMRTRHARDRAEQILSLVGLGQLRGLPSAQLSGGQQALLQVGMGLMIEDVKLYLLDEPFAGIHPAVKDTIVDIVWRVNAGSGTTFILISHEMGIVRRLCHRVSVLVDGAVLTEGAMADVVADDRVIDAYLGRGPETGAGA